MCRDQLLTLRHMRAEFSAADSVNDGCLLVCVDDSTAIADSPNLDVDVTVEVVDIHWEKTGLPFISRQLNITILNLHT